MRTGEAFLAAAAYMRSHFFCYNFSSLSVPRPGCGGRACAYGWVCHFFGLAAFLGHDGSHYQGPHLDVRRDFPRYSEFTAHMASVWRWYDIVPWEMSRRVAARCLRRYAERYYPAPVVKIPNWNALASEPLPMAERVAQV